MNASEDIKGGGAAGRCFDIQRFSIHDGPGIRTTVFLKGCPLACPWCHNPESRSADLEIHLFPDRCIRCGACIEACPTGAAADRDGRPALDPDRCIRCGACAGACPSGARRVVGRSLTAGEVLRTVERDRPFYEESGGGVTFSGGEPLLQPEFLLACLRACRRAGLHTAVDTCGFAPKDLVLEVAASTDLFLYDLKLLDDDRHRRHTGVPVLQILENLRALDAAEASIWLRVPLIPGFNDGEEDLEALGAFAGGLRSARRLHLLPYHGIGAEKYRRRGSSYILEGLAPPTREGLERAERILARCGLDVRIGG